MLTSGYWILSLILVLSVAWYHFMYKVAFTNYVAPYAPKSQKNWWRQPGWERFGYPYYSFWQKTEGYEKTACEYNEIRRNRPRPYTWRRYM